MSVQDWSTNPAENTSIDGVNIAEGCAAANVNDAIRRVMASTRVFYDDVPVTSSLMPVSGGVFTGNPTYSGRGGYLYHNSSSNTSGLVFIQASGGSVPSGMANGDLLLEY